MQRFRSFEISAEDGTVKDRYRFELTGATDHGVTFRETEATGALHETIDFTFTTDALESGAGLLAIKQTNDVTHEDDSTRRSWDGQYLRTITLVDTTPPFWLSRRLAREAAETGRIVGLRFFHFLRQLPPLLRDGDADHELTVRGEKHEVRAERYRDPDDDGNQLLLLRELPGFGEVSLVLDAVRANRFAVSLLTID